MAKVEVQRLKAEERQRLRGLLASLLENVTVEGNLSPFLPAFFTSSELVMFGRRIDTALGLLAGTSGEDIRRTYGISYTTISLIDDMLMNELPDYRSTIPGLLKKPPQVIRRGIARLQKRAPVIAALVEITMEGK